jgi:hypothetical protein
MFGFLPKRNCEHLKTLSQSHQDDHRPYCFILGCSLVALSQPGKSQKLLVKYNNHAPWAAGRPKYPKLDFILTESNLYPLRFIIEYRTLCSVVTWKYLPDSEPVK